MNSKAKGERTEGIILAHLLKMGFSVSLPFGNNQKYDLILDDRGKLYKVQCKTARIVNGCVTFNPCVVNGFKNTRTTYVGLIDIFLVYCPQNDSIYRIAVGDAGVSEMRLRIDPPKRNRNNKINWAKDYLFDADTEI